MKREIIIFIVLFSLFLAIGCTSNTDRDTQKPATPAETPSIPIAESAVPPVLNSTIISANQTPSIPVPNATAETPAESKMVESKIVEVSINDFAFNPEAVTISGGDTVR